MSWNYRLHYYLIESDKTTSIYNVSTRVLSKKIKHLLREENKVKENKIWCEALRYVKYTQK